MMTLQELIVKSYKDFGYIPTITIIGDPCIMDLSDGELLNLKIKSVKEIKPEEFELQSKLIVEIFV